jgi:hypothetical protein
MISTRELRSAVVAAVVLGAVMTLGDFAWASLNLRHRAAYGLAHGAVMCLCMGMLIGGRVGRSVIGALSGIVIGLVAAGAFYLLAPMLRWGAMLPAWMLFWVLFAALQQRLRPGERPAAAVARGLVAAVFSGVAFYLISGIWTRPSPGGPNYIVNFFSWSFAFLPGFLSLFWSGGNRMSPTNTDQHGAAA